MLRAWLAEDILMGSAKSSDAARKLTAADFVTTEAEHTALQALRDATGKENGAMERHSLRVFMLADQMALKRNETVDREVMLTAALLHEIGLYPEVAHHGVYVRDGAEYAAGLLAFCGWTADRLRLCMDVIERHHEVRPQWSRGAEVELIRRADLAELSVGAIRFGLPLGTVLKVFRAVPRRGTYFELGRRLGRTAIARPHTLPRIFLRPG